MTSTHTCRSNMIKVTITCRCAVDTCNSERVLSSSGWTRFVRTPTYYGDITTTKLTSSYGIADIGDGWIVNFRRYRYSLTSTSFFCPSHAPMWSSYIHALAAWDASQRELRKESWLSRAAAKLTTVIGLAPSNEPQSPFSNVE